MFTASNDGTIIVWSSTGTVHQRIEVDAMQCIIQCCNEQKLLYVYWQLNHPVYCLAWQHRRSQLIAGMNGSIRAYDVKEGWYHSLHMRTCIYSEQCGNNDKPSHCVAVGSLTGAPYLERKGMVCVRQIVKCLQCCMRIQGPRFWWRISGKFVIKPDIEIQVFSCVFFGL